MKEIKLTQGFIAFVDDDDFERVNQFKWYVLKSKYTNYTQRCFIIQGKHYFQYMHHLILKIKNAKFYKIETDHIDRNGLNNQKHNLRICTKSQNLMNMKSNRNKTSIYKGVFWDKSRNKFQSKIMCNNKSIYIGRFISEIDAAKLYDQYARLNFPI